MSTKLLIAIVGPTAVGKTAIAIKLARELHTEIVSADSRQFYREMEIGTAKPNAEELKTVKHHFINNLSIQDEYNAGKYELEALACLDELFKKHDKVIVAGGSGMFIDALCKGFDKLPEADIELRERYEALLKDKGIGVLQQELQEKDLAYYNEVDKNNPRRLIRALDVIQQTGQPYSKFRLRQPAQRSFSMLKIGLNVDKELLRERIDKRVDEMLAKDWLGECKALYAYKNINALRTVGYTELFNFIDGKTDWPTTVQNIKTNTWHYAKRQLTWFKKDKEVKWFSPEQYIEIRSIVYGT